jgi:hypothetical protein
MLHFSNLKIQHQMPYQLAQINIAKLLEPIDSPLLEDFVADLARINSIAENSEGFIWRLKDDVTANATSFNPFNDDSLIVNMSVWKDIEALKNFTYKSGHIEVFMKRAKWFERMTEAHMALWWIEEGNFPTAENGRDKLLELRANGESESVFSFRKVFDQPDLRNL